MLLLLLLCPAREDLLAWDIHGRQYCIGERPIKPGLLYHTLDNHVIVSSAGVGTCAQSPVVGYYGRSSPLLFGDRIYDIILYYTQLYYYHRRRCTPYYYTQYNIIRPGTRVAVTHNADVDAKVYCHTCTWAGI